MLVFICGQESYDRKSTIAKASGRNRVPVKIIRRGEVDKTAELVIFSSVYMPLFICGQEFYDRKSTNANAGGRNKVSAKFPRVTLFGRVYSLEIR